MHVLGKLRRDQLVIAALERDDGGCDDLTFNDLRDRRSHALSAHQLPLPERAQRRATAAALLRACVADSWPWATRLLMISSS